MIQVTVNGQSYEVPPGTTILALLQTASVPENYLAVEVNADVVPRSLLASHPIEAGDVIEVVTLVGGG